MNIEEIKDRVNKTKNAFHKLGIEGQVNINLMINDIEFLQTAYEKEKEKNKKAIDFINDKNNYFEDGDNWQNILKIKEILEE